MSPVYPLTSHLSPLTSHKPPLLLARGEGSDGSSHPPSGAPASAYVAEHHGRHGNGHHPQRRSLRQGFRREGSDVACRAGAQRPDVLDATDAVHREEVRGPLLLSGHPLPGHPRQSLARRRLHPGLRLVHHHGSQHPALSVPPVPPVAPALPVLPALPVVPVAPPHPLLSR